MQIIEILENESTCIRQSILETILFNILPYLFCSNVYWYAGLFGNANTAFSWYRGLHGTKVN